MKSRILTSILVIALAAALIGGATMAWFTAKAEAENEFNAGTVLISAKSTATAPCTSQNVNPGDCYKWNIRVRNDGSKEIALRMKLNEFWEFNESWLQPNMDALCFSDWCWVDFQEHLETLESPATFTIEGWEKIGDWWYYDGTLAAEGFIAVEVDVCFAGEEMGNEFQAAKYSLGAYFEAIQSSNNAPQNAGWGTPVQECSWTGVWDTERWEGDDFHGTSEVTFTQHNSTVTGRTPDSPFGYNWFEGEIDGETLTGTWGHSLMGDSVLGTFEITMSEDCSSFEGELIEAVDPPRTYSWTGVRQ